MRDRIAHEPLASERDIVPPRPERLSLRMQRQETISARSFPFEERAFSSRTRCPGPIPCHLLSLLLEEVADPRLAGAAEHQFGDRPDQRIHPVRRAAAGKSV